MVCCSFSSFLLSRECSANAGVGFDVDWEYPQSEFADRDLLGRMLIPV